MAWIGKTRPGPLVALHPGSGGRHKCWPPDRYGRLCDRLTAMGYTPVLTAGPADEGVIQAVMAGASAARPVVVDQAPLTHLAGLLTRCRAMMGNDSGITHLAAAVGIPTIALFGPTDPAVWGPRGKTVRIVWGEEVVEEDAGMSAWPAPFAARALTAVSVEAVLSVFTAL
jgi:ADP-heptose:LPS heptosyltransferase